MFGAILLSVAVGLGLHVAEPAVGVLLWIAGLLLAGRLYGLQRLQTRLMLVVGAARMACGLGASNSPDWLQALAGNQALRAMLASVSFLRLISLPTAERSEPDPRGHTALWRTLLGVHLFGAAAMPMISSRPNALATT